MKCIGPAGLTYRSLRIITTTIITVNQEVLNNVGINLES